MRYTKEESESIKANLIKIQEYIKVHYVPQLRMFEYVSVAFGKLSGRSGKLEYSFGFKCEGEIEIWYRCNGRTLFFTAASGKYPSNSIFDVWTDAIGLLLHWKQVKQLIESELNKRKQTRDALVSFEV